MGDNDDKTEFVTLVQTNKQPFKHFGTKCLKSLLFCKYSNFVAFDHWMACIKKRRDKWAIMMTRQKMQPG